jgi:hypothetical protein
VYFKQLLKVRVRTGILAPIVTMVVGASAFVSPVNFSDSFPNSPALLNPDTTIQDSIQLPYPWPDNLTDPISNKPSESPLYLGDPANIQRSVEYDE